VVLSAASFGHVSGLGFGPVTLAALAAAAFADRGVSVLHQLRLLADHHFDSAGLLLSLTMTVYLPPILDRWGNY
jgi:hypothetical protein